jgi:bacterial/archaeal transporter family-2 protein
LTRFAPPIDRRPMSPLVIMILLALVAGACLPAQAGINAGLVRWAGSAVIAAAVSFAVGTVALGAYTLAARLPLPSFAQAGQEPWWAWSGGVLGAFYVSAIIFVAPRLGAASTLALVVAGQMAASLVLDHFGWLGFRVQPANIPRLLGALLLVGGVVLMRR